MNQERELKLIEDVATHSEQLKNIVAQNAKLDAKMDSLIGHIVKVGAENEAHVISLKVSLKNKINDSIDRLNCYHDDDVEPIKKAIEPMKKNTFIVIGANKFLLTLFFAIFLFAFWQQINQVIYKQFGNTGVKKEMPSIVTRGGSVFNSDTLKSK